MYTKTLYDGLKKQMHHQQHTREIPMLDYNRTKIENRLYWMNHQMRTYM